MATIQPIKPELIREEEHVKWRAAGKTVLLPALLCCAPLLHLNNGKYFHRIQPLSHCHDFHTPAAVYHQVGSELHILADLHILGVDLRA